MIPMLVGARFRRPAVKAGPKRAKVWLGSGSAASTAFAPSTVSVVTLIGEAAIEAQGKPTLARVRGTWIARNDQSASGTAAFMSIACGITVVSTKAVAVGTTAVPTPLTNVEWPWLWWDTQFVGNEPMASGDITSYGGNRMIDSKAMRKLPPASALVMVVETSAALEGAPDLNFDFELRMLLMPS